MSENTTRTVCLFDRKQGFYEADTRADKAATMASQESVHLTITHAANRGLALK